MLYDSHAVFLIPTYPIFAQLKGICTSCTRDTRDEIELSFSFFLAFLLYFFHRVHYSSEKLIKSQSPSCPRMMHIPVYLRVRAVIFPRSQR